MRKFTQAWKAGSAQGGSGTGKWGRADQKLAGIDIRDQVQCLPPESLDKTRDGCTSRDEFLGPGRQLCTMDRDYDGLIPGEDYWRVLGGNPMRVEFQQNLQSTNLLFPFR